MDWLELVFSFKVIKFYRFVLFWTATVSTHRNLVNSERYVEANQPIQTQAAVSTHKNFVKLILWYTDVGSYVEVTNSQKMDNKVVFWSFIRRNSSGLVE